MLSIQPKPYESKLSTALSECKAVARCATRKTNAAINRIKTIGTHKLRIEKTSGHKQDKNRWGAKLNIEKREEREIQQDTTDKKSQMTKRDIEYDKNIHIEI